MEVTKSLLASMPIGNLRVPLAEFGAVWADAEQLSRAQSERPDPDWFPAGVAVTCRWLAGAITHHATPNAASAVRLSSSSPTSTPSVMPRHQRARIAAEDGAASLARVLRRAELAGHDPRRTLVDAIAEAPLTGAKNTTNVLYSRITDGGNRRFRVAAG